MTRRSFWPRVVQALGALSLAVAVTVTVTACSPDPVPPDPATSSVPASGSVRYDPAGLEDFCGRVPWDDVASEFGIAVGDVRAQPGASSTIPSVRCGLSNLTGEYLDESHRSFNVGELNLLVAEYPQDAHDYHLAVVESASDRFPDAQVSAADGWWREGTRLLHESGGSNGADAWVLTYVYHENLAMSILVSLRRMDSLADSAHMQAFASALIDEVRAQLPCQPTGDTPAASC